MGARIRKRREQLKISREKFSEKIGVTTKFYSDIETGAKGFSIKTLTRISKELGVTTDYILFGDDKNLEIKNIDRILQNIDLTKLSYVEEIIRLLAESYKN